ncbi:MAG: hypothetical protein SNJ78_12785, partial [Spirochaetales bacterium]
VGESSIEEWEVRGFTELEGDLYLYGALFKELPFPLLDLLKSPPVTTFPPKFLLLLSRLALLAEKGLLPRKMYPEGIFFINDGRILILNEGIMEKALSLLPLAERLKLWEPFNHPNLEKEANTSFFLASLLYQLFTGTAPFEGSTEEDIHTRICFLPPLPLLFARMGVRQDFSDFLQQILTNQRTVSLVVFKHTIQEFSQSPLLQTLSYQEQETLQRKASEFLASRGRMHKRRNFWQRNRSRVALGVVLTILLGFFTYDYLSHALRPPRTKGMSAEEVVVLFYTSLNTLDHQAMEDCVAKKVGKSYIDEVMNLYVISRMRMSVELRSNMIDADTWYRKGKPPLSERETLYGIANLTVLRSPSSKEDTETYRVEFHYWKPVPVQPNQGDSTSNIRFQGWYITDTVSLRKEKERWIIFEIQRISSTPITP